MKQKSSKGNVNAVEHQVATPRRKAARRMSRKSETAGCLVHDLALAAIVLATGRPFNAKEWTNDK